MNNLIKNKIYISINMTSTRNINTSGDYKLQQSAFNRNMDEVLYKFGSNGPAYNPALPCGGSAPPSMMMWDTLSHNPVEIESSLFGINSNNLVNPQPDIQPQLKSLRNVQFFKRPTLVIPKKLVIPTNQRAEFLSN